MANVVYRGKSITFPDGMSEAEIAQAMPSIADQIDTDFLNESSAQKTPDKKESFSDKAVSLAKDAAGYIKNNALKLPIAIAKELKSNSVVDGMDGVSVKANQESESTLKKVLDKNKKPNNLQEGSEVVDGIAGVAKVGLNRGYAGLGKIEAGLVKSLADLTGSEKLADIAESQNKYANEIENRAVLRGSPVEGFAKESIVQDLPEAGSNAISSVIQTAPALAIGAASGGSGLPALFGGVGLQEYNEGREKDLSPFQSATRAVPMAVAEVVGEKLGGFDKIAKGLRQATKGNGVADLGAAMLESSLKELPAEELTTTLQFLVDKTPGIGLNQDATFDDYKKAVKDTALATILQSGGMGAGGAVLTNIANKLDAPTGTQEAAEIDQQLLNAFNASQQVKQDQLQQAEADVALANITSPDTTIDDAIALAEKATDVPTAKPTGLLSAVSEAIPASDILGDENVSDTTNATTDLANETITGSSDNIQGSLGDLPNQLAGRSDTGPIDNSTEASAQGSGSDQLNGNGIQGNDAIAILNGEDAVSRPFAQATDDFLPKMRSMTTDEKVIGQIDEELKLRGITNVDSVNTPTERVDETAKDVHVGEKINKEWTAFSPESGTLNIPRSEMPQVKAEHRGAMVNFLNARGVDHTQETVPASSLKPTQQEFSEAKVKKASEYAGGDRSILVSADNHVLDGHHQWLSKLNKGGDVDVIRLNAPIAQLLNDVKEFPSSTVEDGATTSKVQKPKSTKQYKPKTLLATLRDIGGIKLSEKQDVTGEVKGFAPGGYNQVFKQTSNRSLKGLIESGDLDDYLPYNMRLESNGANDDAFDSTEAYDYLADKIRNGESVLPYAVEEEVKANQYYQEVEATAQDILDDFAKNFNEDEINAELQIAGTNEREAFTDVHVFKPDSENGDTGSGERGTAATETNASQQAEVDNKSANKTASIKDAEQDKSLLSDSKDNKTDLLGDNTTAKQAVADAERAKDAKRNSGNDNQDTFTLTGSNSEADQAAAAGAQDLFAAPIKQQSNAEASTGADVAENTANQSSNGQANEEASEIDYNGVRLYKIKVRNRVEGQPPTEMWAVESTENKERKARGERALGGDTLSETLDEAKAEADLMIKRDAEKTQSENLQAEREAQQQEQSRIEAESKSDIDGFGSELNAMQLGKLKETLNKPTSINGKVSPLRDAVRNLVAQGGKPEIKEENVYKGMSRAQYNRADNRAQQEDEKRIRDGGKKNVYYITMPDGGMYELGKTAHDFADYLIANQVSKPQDELTSAKADPDAEGKAKAQDDLDNALSDLGDIFGKTYRKNITSEQEQKLIPVLTKVFDAAFRLGYYDFKAAAKFVLDTIRNKLGADVAETVNLDQLQGAYISMAGKYGAKATSKRDVVNVESIEELQENDNVNDERGGTNLERDSENADATNNLGEENVQDERNGNRGSRGRRVSSTQGNSNGPNSNSLFDSETIVTGERGNSEVYTGKSPTQAGIARDNDNRGSGDSGLTGTPIEQDPEQTVDKTAESGISLLKAKEQQKAAENKPQNLTLENIKETLPLLKEGQQEDVFKAESKFAEPEGYGMLFTNGTGTGKTFTGLGVIKRFAKKGKTNILVIAPNDKIIEDWQNTGKLFNLQINRLENTNDAGNGITIATYANVGANETLADREWDLIVTDEAHYLAMDKDGTNTNALKKVRAITNHPQGKFTKYEMLNRVNLAKRAELNEKITANTKIINNDDTMDEMVTKLIESNKILEMQLSKVNERLEAKKQENSDFIDGQQGQKRTRALFLSATPFAYEKTVDWANGYIFDYDEGKKQDGASGTGGRAYNAGSNRDQFMMQNFGYRMRYNKLTEPDAKVNRGLMQRQFNTMLKKRGTLSGRMLDVDADYDRKFILIDSAIGRRIDEALGWFDDKRKEIADSARELTAQDKLKSMAYFDVNKIISDQFDYLSRRYLLEAIKAKEVIVHVKEHMALGRKVVVFHDYKKGGGFNPFNINTRAIGEEFSTSGDTELINQVIEEFRSEFKDLINSPEFRASSPINAFQEAFKDVLLFNGDVPTKTRRANVAKFQDDASGPQVILVQSAAGKEGISLHDTTGKYQRVLFNLGQPTQPTTSIQQEGRIYRTGQVTNAMFRYLNTGTNWERWAFATTIAQRASAAENLALGEQARALKDAFISGFEESDNYRAGMKGEGTGGKERDKAANEALTEYDRAKAFYYGTQKKNSKTKAEEGADYFATPEPVGLKMVELADIRPGERVLEPSAGHGAIARWFPEGSDKTAIEPSGNLRPRLAMVFDGAINSGDFEDLNIINKFDAIIMNPPFGTAGRTAIDHVAKAAKHLKDGGRIVALIPVGSTDKKFDKWFYETETRPLKPIITITGSMSGSQKLPDTPIYKGDTIQLSAYTDDGVVRKIIKAKDNMVWFSEDGKGELVVSLSAISKVNSTGKRTEEYSPAKGFSLVANIKLPSVTFERAGTAVNTRIVVIEKSDDAPQQTNRDYTDVDNINDLFDRMETLQISPRAKPIEAETETDAPVRTNTSEKTRQNDQAARERDVKAMESGAIAKDGEALTFEFKDGKLITNAPAEKITTSKGKELEGVFITDPSISLSTIKEVDNFTYYPKGKSAGYFVRLRHVVRPIADDDVPMFTRNNKLATGLPKEAIQRAVNVLRRNWKNAPEIIVVQDMSDPAIREAVREENDRQLSQGAEGQPEGFFDAGKVYIVASEMNSPDDLIRVVFHETLGHYGLRGLYGKELGGILDRVAMLRKRDMAKKAKQYGLDLTKKSDVRIIAEEVLAEMAQTAPEASFVKRAIAAIRQFLRDIGVKLELTDNDIIANYLVPARNYVTQGAQQRGLVGNLSTAFNRDNSTTTAQLFKELTLNDDMFKYPKSNAADMQEVFNEVAPGLLYIEKSKSFDDEVSELYSVYPIDASGNPIRSKVGFINVYDDGKVEINVSSLGEGFGGSGIYAAVGNWAYNNGKVFAGDRGGISPAGISRRLENMISLALKFGTTDHIMPHKDQMNDLGFDWKEGDTEYNLAEMLKASFNAIRNGVYVTTDNFGIEVTEKSNDAKGVSKLDDLVYDFDKHMFMDVSNGQEYTESDFEKLARTAEARNTYAGRKTLQRAAIGNTFMGATGEGKRSLLEQLGKLSLQHLELTDPQLAGIFYSRSTPQTETPQFKAWFKDSKVVDKLGNPLEVFHGSPDARFVKEDGTFKSLNERYGQAGGERAFWFASSRQVANTYADDRRAFDYQKAEAGIVPAYLSIQNPLIVDGGGKVWREAQAIGKTRTVIEKAQEDGHDGVIIKNVKDDYNSNATSSRVTDTYVVFSSNQIKSSTDNNGDFDPANPDIRFSRTVSPQGRLTPQWQVDETSKMDNVIRALQDKYIDLKRVTQEIKKAGNDISDRWNAYLQEELYHGRSAKRVQDFIKQDLTPLIEDMRMRGVGMADFEEYLWMRHAPERNEQIAKINPDMPDGGAGVTTAEAESYMDGLNPADKKKYEALAKRIDAITAKSRQVLVDYGLESQATVNAWQSAYEFYVPLMREDMERGTGNGTGTGFKVKGNSSKRAMGSNRAVVDVIANIAQQYEKNIVRGEKNRVATAMIGLAKLNPNEEFWNVETPPTIRHVSKATGLVETRTDPNYKNRNNVIVARIVNKRGEIEERSVTFNEFNDRAMKMALSLNNLDVDQVSAVSNFMGNITRYFSSINTQYNPIFGIVNITRDTQGAILNLSTTELAGKQKEVLANIMPALRGIYAETRTDNGIKSPMQFGSFTAAQKSKAQAMRALWEEYQREGGTTGFRDMYANAEERTKAVSKALDPNWWTKTLAGKVVTVGGVLTVPETVLKDKAIKPVFDWLSDYNQTLENAVRLAAYKVAIDSGISKQQAASIGKNLTVNFNRKGAYTRTMGSWYAFFNAAVQGTARIGETFTGPKGKQIIAGGISIGVAQALMLAMAGFDEDEPPEFVRSSNFIIPIPNTDQKYITIPMPLGFNVLPNFGRITTEWALSGAEKTTERVFDIFGAVMESFNPLGGNGRIDSIIMPTVADPFNDLSKNEDWTGRNIAQEDFSNLRPTPGYTRTRDKATELSIELARWINNLSGGDDYEKGQLSPTGDQIEYLTGQLTGGVGREFVKSVNTIESIVTGEDLPTYKIPLVGRFVGNSAGQAPQAGKFYNNLIKLNKLEAGYLGRLKDGKDADTFLNENPELNYVDYGKKAQSAISKLRDYKRDLVKEGANREEVKLVDEQITLIMTEFNQTVKPETTNP